MSTTTTEARTCGACGAKEVRTYERGRLVRTTIDPISRLCVRCLAQRTAAAPAGALFDRTDLEPHRNVPRGTPVIEAMTARTHDDDQGSDAEKDRG
jgi:hypothetical protein